MANTITVDAKTFNQIISRLDKLTKDMEAIKAKLAKKNPKYGSDEWWEKSEKQADKDIKEENWVEFSNVEDAIKWLNS